MGRLLVHDDLRQNLPLGCNDTVRQDYFAGLLERLAADGRGRDRAGEFLREWNAYMRVPTRIALPAAPLRQKTPLSMTTRIRLAQRDGLFLESAPDPRAIRFKAVGREYNMAAQIAPALERLSGHESLAVGELCAGLGDPNLSVALVSALETLAGHGVILKE
jgi:hypothetical protein